MLLPLDPVLASKKTYTMEKDELLLKTLFCCSACDGVIAKEEVELVKNLTKSVRFFNSLNVEDTLNSYISEINAQGKGFLKDYLGQLSDAELTDDEQIQLIELAIKMIEADCQILYSEVKFFKKIRAALSVSDEVILESLPYAEDYLLPDVISEDKDFEEVGDFKPSSFTFAE